MEDLLKDIKEKKAQIEALEAKISGDLKQSLIQLQRVICNLFTQKFQLLLLNCHLLVIK